MVAIHLTRFGEPEQSLKAVDVPEPPAPDAGQALIQVEYAPLDHHDLLLAKGIYPVRPELHSVIGNEGAGTVLAVGPDVAHIRPGDRVLLPFGTFARSEQVLAEAAKLTAVDKSISLDQAAMLRINPTTAGLLVESRDLPAGSWVVQNAANSGVGRSVIAFAKERGFRPAPSSGPQRGVRAPDRRGKAGVALRPYLHGQGLLQGPRILAEERQGPPGLQPLPRVGVVAAQCRLARVTGAWATNSAPISAAASFAAPAERPLPEAPGFGRRTWLARLAGCSFPGSIYLPIGTCSLKGRNAEGSRRQRGRRCPSAGLCS
ncbi:alcohol dehydrogenase catalytic domain-containing protein [Streptomyces sp. NPDC001970]